MKKKKDEIEQKQNWKWTRKHSTKWNAMETALYFDWFSKIFNGFRKMLFNIYLSSVNWMNWMNEWAGMDKISGKISTAYTFKNYVFSLIRFYISCCNQNEQLIWLFVHICGLAIFALVLCALFMMPGCHFGVCLCHFNE